MGKLVGVYAMPHPPIMVPEVGKGEESKIKDTVVSCMEIAEEIEESKPDTIVLVTPHGPVFRDALALSTEKIISGDLGKFGVNEVSINLGIDIELTNEIMRLSSNEGIVTVGIDENTSNQYGIDYELDHGAIVPLYFINKLYKDYKIVHITYGMLPKIKLYQFGMAIKKAVEGLDRNIAFIASGDLSHKLKDDGPYKYSKYGEKFDKEIVSLLEEGNVRGVFNIDQTTINEAAECGLRSFYIMLGLLDDYNVKGNLLSYEGTFGVGYAVMKFELEEKSESTYRELVNDLENKYNKKNENLNPYVRLARDSLTYYLINGEYMDIPDYVLDEMLNIKRSVFVSLKEEDRLRGCIGSTMPRYNNLAEEIINYAVEAGINDPRFPSVNVEELRDIDFSVDVLTEAKPCTIEDLDPKKYGVIVRKGYKTGLLLPDLEGVDTVDYQLEIALQKAGIKDNEEFEVERFEVIRYK